MNEKKLFTNEVVRAILKRKDKLNNTVIIVSKLMEAYGMSEYTRTAENLILAEEASDSFLNEHVVLDFMKGDIWLDEAALYYYSDILTGFIDNKEFESFMQYIGSCENLNRINNQAIMMYREKSIIELFKSMKHYNQFKKSLPDEVRMIKKWCLLELLSRTCLPKAYYFIKELPMTIKVRYISSRIKRNLLADLQK